MPLTDVAIRQAKPRLKPFRLFDERGLYLEISPGGGKWWRLKFRFGGKEKRLSLGVYPDVGLREARERRDEARKLLARGVDPSLNRKARKQAREDEVDNTFEVLAREWHSENAHTWSTEHRDDILRRLARNIFPWIGKRPIGDITAPELLPVIQRIASRGALETAHRALGTCGQIFRYSVVTGRAQRDVAADLRGALPPTVVKHLAAPTDPKHLGELLRVTETYKGTLITRCALRLAPLVFTRPGELRKAEWQHIDLEAAEWRFQASKSGPPHIVPLSIQALAILKELQPLTGDGPYVFEGARSKTRPMSENTVNSAFRRLDISEEELCGHGFRASARTILEEVLEFRSDIIEHQLAHKVKDPNGRAYNRTTHLPERRRMMQAWADYLDQIKSKPTQESP